MSRFLQIHTLTPYAGVLLNRDDSRVAKRLPYGGVSRTRISSQCSKWHWRKAKDPFALENIGVPSVRSRFLVDRVIEQAQFSGAPWDKDVADALAPWFRYAIYGSRPEDAPKARGERSRFDDERQPLLLGLPEIEWLGKEFARLMARAGGNPDKAFKLAAAWVKGSGKGGSRTSFAANLAAMRRTAQMPGGLTAALFGRMVTSDAAANIAAAVHVAHAFSVHAEETEMDYLTAVDDLLETGSSVATIQETELTSSLFYGYVVVDIPTLAANLGEELPTAPLTEKVLYSLIHLIAEVSLGAKLGSTAPYSRASLMLLEAGDRQPRSLAEAYRTPCAPELGVAAKTLASHLRRLDEVYATGEQRRFFSIADVRFPGAERGNLGDLADWASKLPRQLSQ